MIIHRFDLVLVDFTGGTGSEQSSIRPAVVVSNEASCIFSPIVIVIPFTSKMSKTEIPTHKLIKSEIGGLMNDSILLGEQPTPIDRSRIKKHLGHIFDQNNRNLIDQACFDAFFYKKELHSAA